MDAEHDDDGVGLLVGEDALRGGGPIGGLAARLILDQAGHGLVLADDAHVRLLGIGVFQAIAEPVGHGVAEHQHVTFSHGVTLGGAGRAGKILARRLRGLLLLLEWREEIAAEPAAATSCGACRCGGPPKPPKLKNCADAGPAIPIRSAIATASATSGPVSVNTRKKDVGFGIRLGRNGFVRRQI